MKKALVVDDTKSSRILLTKCLEHEGYLVTTAGKGKQALELLRTDHYNIVFLDVKMPFMSGTEVYKWMKQNGIQTPVVITTAYATVKNAVECTQMGAVAYLQKPFTMEKFKELLSEIEQRVFYEDWKGFSDINEQSDLQKAKKELECGRTEAALMHLKQALSIDPVNSEIYLLLSKVYSLIGNEEYTEKFMKAYEAFK
ncbi:response regulator [Desulfitobacterium sp.]|uniref:response regulator n=1 Tax=Desulfitobacterium sp. TaxID=49981 RepID=UPI002B218EF2|nr:response regulator [Desulfitobacterium sp.]MEA4902596.1 response regulator [Desulfitobacterium sp.]